METLQVGGNIPEKMDSETRGLPSSSLVVEEEKTEVSAYKEKLNELIGSEAEFGDVDPSLTGGVPGKK